MAISLDDLKVIKENKKEIKKEQKNFVLRPWQSFSNSNIETRTLRAQEAVRKAEAIVKDNNLMVDEIRGSNVSSEEASKHDDNLKNRHEKFDFKDDDFELRILSEVKSQREKSGIWGMIKSIF